MATNIWIGKNTRVWYNDRYNNRATHAEVEKIEYLAEAGRCSYCGHECEPGKECPGCSARKHEDGRLLVGRARVTLIEHMPWALWMFRYFERVELHIAACGSPVVYDNYEYRIIMTNIQNTGTSIGGIQWDEAIRALLTFTCDIVIEEKENQDD